jgi:hypothetical protein
MPSWHVIGRTLPVHFIDQLNGKNVFDTKCISLSLQPVTETTFEINTGRAARGGNFDVNFDRAAL